MFEEAQGRRSSARLYAVGSHRPEPPDGCLMEIAARLAGEPWTDHPECVHPTLGAVARGVYDHSSTEARRGLLPLAPSLIGTASTGLETSARLVATCVSTALSSPVPERIADDEAGRLEAARRTALYMLARCEPPGAQAEPGEDIRPRMLTRMWLRSLDPLRLTEPVYRRLVSAEAAAEAVAVTARASGDERDRRLSQLLRWCIALTRRLRDERPGDAGPHRLQG